MGGHDSAQEPKHGDSIFLHSRQELRQDRADASLLGPLRLIAQHWLDAAGSDRVWVEDRALGADFRRPSPPKCRRRAPLQSTPPYHPDL